MQSHKPVAINFAHYCPFAHWKKCENLFCHASTIRRFCKFCWRSRRKDTYYSIPTVYPNSGILNASNEAKTEANAEMSATAVVVSEQATSTDHTEPSVAAIAAVPAVSTITAVLAVPAVPAIPTVPAVAVSPSTQTWENAGTGSTHHRTRYLRRCATTGCNYLTPYLFCAPCFCTASYQNTRSARQKMISSQRQWTPFVIGELQQRGLHEQARALAEINAQQYAMSLAQPHAQPQSYYAAYPPLQALHSASHPQFQIPLDLLVQHAPNQGPRAKKT